MATVFVSKSVMSRMDADIAATKAKIAKATKKLAGMVKTRKAMKVAK